MRGPSRRSRVAVRAHAEFGRNCSHQGTRLAGYMMAVAVHVGHAAGVPHVGADRTAESLGRNRIRFDGRIRQGFVRRAIAQREDLQLVRAGARDIHRRADQHAIGNTCQPGQPTHGAAAVAHRARHGLAIGANRSGQPDAGDHDGIGLQATVFHAFCRAVILVARRAPAACRPATHGDDRRQRFLGAELYWICLGRPIAKLARRSLYFDARRLPRLACTESFLAGFLAILPALAKLHALWESGPRMVEKRVE